MKILLLILLLVDNKFLEFFYVIYSFNIVLKLSVFNNADVYKEAGYCKDRSVF